MPESLEDFLSRMREDRTPIRSEQATRQGVILPMLGRLGWDRDNVHEVFPEFPVGDGWVDYCLKVGERNAVFIEVKPPSERLEQHEKQLLDYAFRYGVGIAALSNGLSWWLYLPLLQGEWNQRKFFTIDIQQQDVETAARHFRQFLGRDVIADGSAMKSAEAVYTSREKARLISQTIPRAWKMLCQEPETLLVDLLVEKVEGLCGHKPEEESVKEFLKRLTSGAETGPEISKPEDKPHALRRNNEKRVEPSPSPITNKKAVAYTFKGKRQAVSTFKDILIGLCLDLYELHPADFDRVLTLKGRRREYFKRDPIGMTTPAAIPGAGVYAETNLSAENIVDQCRALLKLFGHGVGQFQVEVQDR